jgi:mannose-6-phosphate isomerase-like protein (cupin superfamily)
VIQAKPWGSYKTLLIEPGFQVKRIEVNPGCRLSLQTHEKRAEKWTVVSGIGEAAVGDRKIKAVPGTVIDIAVREKHRMTNTGKSQLVFIEVQFGDYLGEDDIVRHEDDYDRK